MKLEKGDRIETRDIPDTCWIAQRGYVIGFDHDLAGNREAAIVQMDNAIVGAGDAVPTKHRFAFKWVRKLSILELIAEAAA
jgi:hypothetical protein